MPDWPVLREAALHHRRPTLGPHSPTERQTVSFIGAEGNENDTEVPLKPATEDCASLEIPGYPQVGLADSLTALSSDRYNKHHTIHRAPQERTSECGMERFCESDGQRLLMWSGMNPHPMKLAANPYADTSEPSISSPKEAIMYSLGNAGLRSYLQPPPLVPRKEWLRQLLLEVVEDATLFFSCLIDECHCGASPIQKRTNPRHTDESRRHGCTNSRSESEVKYVLPEGVAFCKMTYEPLARDYISSTLSWCRQLTQDSRLFPPLASQKATPDTATGHMATKTISYGTPVEIQVCNEFAPRRQTSLAADEGLLETGQRIVRRLLRCYIHAYLQHLRLLLDFGVVAHVNRSLKKLVFVAIDAQLLESHERSLLDPLTPLLEEWSLEDTDQDALYQWSPQEICTAGSAAAKTDKLTQVKGEAKHRRLTLALEQAETRLAQFEEEHLTQEANT